MAVSFDQARGDGAGTAAVVEDAGGAGEREEGVCALEQGLDGDGAGAGGEFLVFFRQVVPVVTFGWWGVVSVLWRHEGLRKMVRWCWNSFATENNLLSCSLKSDILSRVRGFLIARMDLDIFTKSLVRMMGDDIAGEPES